MYDSIVIGAGIAGLVVARQLAQEGKQKVLVVEKRTHIGGNCYDELDEHGVLIHRYGPHIFHTSVKGVFDYLSQFTSWHLFSHQVVADVYGKIIPVPFNLNTLHQVYAEADARRLEKKLVEAYGMESKVPILKLKENEDKEIQQIADYVYENIFLQYTMKQWGQKPEDIDPNVTGRVPIVISYDNRYFQEPYQGMPEYGYNQMFQELANHPNIEMRLDCNCKQILQWKYGQIYFEENLFEGNVIYTGAIDELFDCKYGRLPYRTLDFVFEHYNTLDHQGHSVINYTVSEGYTRITEFKHLTGQKIDGTTIVKEYPSAYEGKQEQIPYYAIMNPENRALYEKYLEETKQFENMYLVGRLAEYQYYNIDAMVEKALKMASNLI